MKRKFSKILGVGLALSLLTSLLMVAAPVLADVGAAEVDVDEDEISTDSEYIITFTVNDGLDDATDWIEIRFAEGTTFTLANVGNTEVYLTAVSDFNADVARTDILAANISANESPDDVWTVRLLLTNLPNDISDNSSIQIEFTDETIITNPDDPGTYTLEVRTEEEDDWVESLEYDIDAPTVGGFVYVYNASGILLATYGGVGALNLAENDGHFDGEDYTIEVGEGTYELDDYDGGGPGDAPITITGEGLTLVGVAGADETKIDADGDGFIITGDEVTVEGFTIDDGDTAVLINASEVVVTNNVITDATIGIEIGLNAITDIEVSNNVIEDCADGIVFLAGAPTDLDDADIKNNTITEASNVGAIVFLGGNDDIDIKNNTITGNETAGIYFADGTQASNNIDIKGNTISDNEGDGIQIDEDDAAETPTDLVITGNIIVNNEGDGLSIADPDGWNDADSIFMFNDVYGNDENVDTDADITNATFNWWGVDDEDDIEDTFTGSGDIEFEPWLTDTIGNVEDGSKVAVDDVSSLDAKDDASVKVSGFDDDNSDGADIISVFKYVANPADDIDDAIAFYDIFILLDDGVVALDEVNGKLKFYDSAITEGAVAHFWTGDFWAEASDQEARDGVVYVDITEDTVPSFDELEETPFVIIAGEDEAALDEPGILAPESGADDISLRPTFAWTAVEDADGYSFQLADNSSFLLPEANFNDDLGVLTTTAYAHPTKLPYSSAYFWRVRAVSGSSTTSKGVTTFEEQSDWVTGVFVTMAEPEEVMPSVVIEEAPPAQIIRPIVEVITPPATPITPGWIYVIIGVGAVLVIALLVLIIRTRRVA